MFAGVRRFFSDWSQQKAFKALPRAERSLVFYAEGRHDWPHLGPVALELTRRGERIVYLTSEPDDPVLTAGYEGITALCIGDGSVRTVLFRQLEADVVVMTLTDLDALQLKRSVYPVHYVYVFHAINSTHMVYRKGAFDAYDTVLCVGPHHVAELRATEKLYGLREKRLVEHGYARLDAILARGSAATPAASGPKRLVLAPSWGECSFIEAPTGRRMVEMLKGAGYHVTIRLHPMTSRRMPRLAAELAREHGVEVITDVREEESLYRSHLMISDWSGAALEYMFGLERPVLFIDTPPKVHNPSWKEIAEEIGLPTLQEVARRTLGEALAPGDLEALPAAVERLCSDPEARRANLRRAREKHVYNVGSSAEAGAAAVLEALGRQRARAVPAQEASSLGASHEDHPRRETA